jgi:YkoY family integral membrane protein
MGFPMFGQTFSPQDLLLIGLLVVLEGVLSIDNALVLGLLAKRLPKRLQSRALTYGLAGAFVFRFIAIGTASYLLRWRIVKLLGGGYLVWVAAKYFLVERHDKEGEQVQVGADETPVLVDDRTGRQLTREEEDVEIRARGPVPQAPLRYPGFWSTVGVIELTDIAFAVDSILAAIALVGSPPAGHEGPHPKLWVVITGGMLGVALMRVAAVVFIRLLERFPRFETSAYLLVTVIGFKLVIDWAANSPENPHAVDFHSPASGAFWIFWLLMIGCFLVGFVPQRRRDNASAT